jgi:predicted neuraminidase
LKSILGEGNVTVTLELANATVINELQNDNRHIYRIHPNPVTSSFQVTGNFQTISLLDMNGNTLLSAKESRMDISSFPNGTYLLKVVTMNDKVVYQKLLKV